MLPGLCTIVHRLRWYRHCCERHWMTHQLHPTRYLQRRQGTHSSRRGSTLSPRMHREHNCTYCSYQMPDTCPSLLSVQKRMYCRCHTQPGIPPICNRMMPTATHCDPSTPSCYGVYMRWWVRRMRILRVWGIEMTQWSDLRRTVGAFVSVPMASQGIIGSKMLDSWLSISRNRMLQGYLQTFNVQVRRNIRRSDDIVTLIERQFSPSGATSTIPR